MVTPLRPTELLKVGLNGLMEVNLTFIGGSPPEFALEFPMCRVVNLENPMLPDGEWNWLDYER